MELLQEAQLLGDESGAEGKAVSVRHRDALLLPRQAGISWSKRVVGFGPGEAPALHVVSMNWDVTQPAGGSRNHTQDLKVQSLLCCLQTLSVWQRPRGGEGQREPVVRALGWNLGEPASVTHHATCCCVTLGKSLLCLLDGAASHCVCTTPGPGPGSSVLQSIALLATAQLGRVANWFSSEHADPDVAFTTASCLGLGLPGNS